MARGPIVQKNINKESQIREQAIVDARKGGKRKGGSSKKGAKSSKK